MLSKQTLEPLEEAQGCILTALKSAAINEKPIVVHQLHLSSFFYVRVSMSGSVRRD